VCAGRLKSAAAAAFVSLRLFDLDDDGDDFLPLDPLDALRFFSCVGGAENVPPMCAWLSLASFFPSLFLKPEKMEPAAAAAAASETAAAAAFEGLPQPRDCHDAVAALAQGRDARR
jgi:hypothetical protein